MNNLLPGKLTELLSGEFVYALGWTILHSFWQCGLVASLLALGLHFSKKLSSNVRYLLAYTALLLCFFISLITFHSYWEQAKAARLALTLEALNITLLATLNVQSLFQQWLASADPFLIWIVGVWLVGCAFMSLRGLVDFYGCMRLTSSAQDSVPQHWHQTLMQLRERVQVLQAVSLRISHHITSPCTLGHFKPVILLPVGLLTSMSQEHIEIILLHELGHIRRHDYAFGLLQMLLKILFFFNPMALWISSVIDTERENACDDIAMDICKSPMMFSQALQEFIAMNHRNIATSAAMPIDGKKMTLLNRIKRQFTQRRTMSQVVEKSIAAGVLLFSCAAACVYAQTNGPQSGAEAALIVPFKHLPAFAKLTETEQQTIAKHFLVEYDSNFFNIDAIGETQLQANEGATLKVTHFSNPLKRKITINLAMLHWLKDSSSINLQKDKVSLFKDDAGNSVIALDKLLAPEALPPAPDAYKIASLNNKFFTKTIKPHNWKEDPADLTFKVSYQYLFIILSPDLLEAAIAGTPNEPATDNNIFTNYSKKSLVRGSPYAGGERENDGSLVVTYDRTSWQEKMDWMHENKLFANSQAKEPKIPMPDERSKDLSNLTSQLDEQRKRLGLSESQFETIYACFHRHFGFEAPTLYRYNMQSSMLRDLLEADDKHLLELEANYQARLTQFKMGPKGDEFYINLVNPDFTTCDRNVN